MNRASKNRVINKFPQPYTKDAAPRQDGNFHIKTRDACASGNTSNIGLRVCKAIVIGDVAVGKTCLINRFVRNAFDNDYKATIGVDFEVERFKILDQDFNLQIWDTAGQERFKCMAAAYYRAAHVIILVFDMTSVTSLENTRRWLDECLDSNSNCYPEVFLVGTKRDLCTQKDIDKMETRAIGMAQDLHAEFWCVSSKSGVNVAEFFCRMVAITFEQAILRGLEEMEQRQGTGRQIGGQIGGGIKVNKKIDLSEDREEKKVKSCCAGQVK
ncbi:ras-related protein Rab-34 [Exaiptasia diaphana]|uniref:Ras-related protein Rab-36 n=1 Tax=Exaiptasia diaphana TaxID=2652724 RepID=A0A913XTW0_EXADI|nr:ras-related protein Rab-34 [Exaiptasia diaphana]KXJ29436.1 Ras-related protein Rab-36 [Exaiptasia diaphana]